MGIVREKGLEKKSLKSIDDLVEAGLIPENSRLLYESVTTRFRLLISSYYASLIDKDDPNCPIRRQCVPDPQELHDMPGFVVDPLKEIAHCRAPGITHRYPDRVLLQITTQCSMFCRFCFRKSLINKQNSKTYDGDMQDALSYIKGNRGIKEVILSGGDPLMRSDQYLESLFNDLSSIKHVIAYRIHSRVPVTLPSRITFALAGVIGNTTRPCRLITHFNHPRELTDKSLEACNRLARAGVEVLNQAVLLGGVNDKSYILGELFKRLFRHGIKPYYLHHPDPARGTSHFHITTEAGWKLYSDLHTVLKPQELPRYVIDIPEAPCKVPVSNLVFIPERMV